MQEIRMTEQPASEVEVDQKFSFAFFCPYTTRTFSGVLKRFTPMNSFATVKLVNLETHEDHEDDSYILGRPEADLSEDVTDRVIRFEIGIRVPGSYRILISMHGKTSDPNTPVHYPALADLWTEDIRVTERKSSKIGSMVAEDGRDSLSKAPTENVAKEELDDSTDDEDEGGVSLSLEQLEDYRMSGSAGEED